MATPPTSPADPRPDGEPYYIDTACPGCGAELVLYDEHYSRELPDTKTWHDEWTCPECDGGLYMDWPDGMFERLNERVEADPEDCITADELGERL